MNVVGDVLHDGVVPLSILMRTRARYVTYVKYRALQPYVVACGVPDPARVYSTVAECPCSSECRATGFASVGLTGERMPRFGSVGCPPYIWAE